MPLTAVVDANFFISLLIEENVSKAVRELVSDGLDAHVPYNCATEVGQALLKHHRRGFISASKARECFELFLESLKTTHDVPQLFGSEPFARCLTFNLSTGDYQYILLAENLRLPLVTADRGIIVNAKSLVKVIDLLSL